VAVLLVVPGTDAATRRPRYQPPFPRKVILTAYCRCERCCGWRRNWFGLPVYANGPNRGSFKHVGITASGRRARVGTIAADTTRYPFNTILYIPGYGYGRVEDRGAAIQGDHLDLFFETHEEARDWGRKPGLVKIWLPAGQPRPPGSPPR